MKKIFKTAALISQQIVKLSMDKGWQHNEIKLKNSFLDEIFAQFSKRHTISNQIMKSSMGKGCQLNEITLEKSSLDEIFAQLSKRYIA